MHNYDKFLIPSFVQY